MSILYPKNIFDEDFCWLFNAQHWVEGGEIIEEKKEESFIDSVRGEKIDVVGEGRREGYK